MGRSKKTDTTEAVNPIMEEVLDEQTNPNAEEILNESTGSDVEQTSETKEESAKETKSKKETANETESITELPANVIEKMRLYPQYEEIWITPKGFVHPVGVPEYLLKGATLYKNEFYNK